jgi:hypothetical protein
VWVRCVTLLGHGTYPHGRPTGRRGRDYYVRLHTNDYSVDPTVIGRMVDVAADLERVRVRAEALEDCDSVSQLLGQGSQLAKLCRCDGQL